ncbi:MAG: tetratricopeptide repeat protein [Bdellovibrionaceae bacterium]|nr:tetratricopeptide repeat protein [Pseudobdellovibrionaceae bacterium]
MGKFFKVFQVATLAFLLTGLTGCLVTRNEAREVERRSQDQVTTMQKANADQSNRFNDVDAEMRSLNGRIEVLENRMQQVQAQASSQQGMDAARGAELERRVTLLQDEIKRLSDLLDATVMEVGALKAGATAAVPEATGKKGAYEIAEELFGKKEWRKAVLAFQKFRDENPKSKRFPKATLRIGQAFQELGMKDDAKTFLEEVISKYPSSDEAKQAKTLLKKK